MFCIFVIAGVIMFGGGLAIAPGWWKLAWVGSFFALLMFLPIALERVVDPLNIRRIRKYCDQVGVTDVEIQSFPNHYGVHFRKDGRKFYAKCRVIWGKVTWKGATPAEV